MANTTVNTPSNTSARRRGHARHDRLEYRFYVAVIFTLAVPFALAAWVLHGGSVSASDSAQPHAGPLSWALAESRLLAAMVFRA